MASRALPVPAVIERLSRGDTLRREIGPRGRQWWFEAPYQIVSDDVAMQLQRGLIASPHADLRLFGLGDSLFPEHVDSQSWRATRGGRQ